MLSNPARQKTEAIHQCSYEEMNALGLKDLGDCSPTLYCFVVIFRKTPNNINTDKGLFIIHWNTVHMFAITMNEFV